MNANFSLKNISVPALWAVGGTVSKAFLIGPAAEDQAQHPTKNPEKKQLAQDDNSLTPDGQSCIFQQ